MDIDKVGRRNMAFLRQSPALTFLELLAPLCTPVGRLLTMKPERLKEAVNRFEKLGIKRGERIVPQSPARAAAL
ncbi:hypothetical protein HU200_060007 [Digitaria exilis]|uniref:Uncharacterized protein n=1 Tax=Digitaria exilis TaxID=1010633 RepID=A0A835E0P6_9POAL|nr:hypothetical protein HU200_060007 [Digitaria exilis]